MQHLLFRMQMNCSLCSHRQQGLSKGTHKEQGSGGSNALLLVPLTRVFCVLQVHHPHAVRFFGACTKRQPYMIVTEYLPGGRWAFDGCSTLGSMSKVISGARELVYVHLALAASSTQCFCSDVLPELPRKVTVLIYLDCAILLCSLADLFKRAEMYFPSMRRAVVIALDCAKGMSYLHCHKCATP